MYAFPWRFRNKNLIKSLKSYSHGLDRRLRWYGICTQTYLPSIAQFHRQIKCDIHGIDKSKPLSLLPCMSQFTRKMPLQVESDINRLECRNSELTCCFLSQIVSVCLESCSLCLCLWISFLILDDLMKDKMGPIRAISSKLSDISIKLLAWCEKMDANEIEATYLWNLLHLRMKGDDSSE